MNECKFCLSRQFLLCCFFVCLLLGLNIVRLSSPRFASTRLSMMLNSQFFYTSFVCLLPKLNFGCSIGHRCAAFLYPFKVLQQVGKRYLKLLMCVSWNQLGLNANF